MSSSKRIKLDTEKDSQNECEGMYLQLTKLKGSFKYEMNSFSYYFNETFEEHVLKAFGKLRHPYRYNATDYGVVGIYVLIDPTNDNTTILVSKPEFENYCIETEIRLKKIEGNITKFTLFVFTFRILLCFFVGFSSGLYEDAVCILVVP